MRREQKRLEEVLADVQKAPRSAWQFVWDTGKAARAVAQGFRGENISLRAAALTYVSLLAMVPLATLAFAVAKAVGHDQLRSAVRDFAVAQLAPGAQETTLEYFDHFVTRASSGILGTLGAVLLVFTSLDLLWNIERSLNDIWRVPKHRSWAPRLAVYWAILTLGPVLLGLSVAGTSTLESTLGGVGMSVPRWLSSTLHIGASTLGLTTLYWVTPNAPVRIRSAFAGGLVGAAAWEIAKHGYAIYASRSFSYGAIYGTLAAIPLFFIWIYVSWWIVLFGARLAYAVQNAGAVGTPAPSSIRARELLCADVLVALCQRFLDGQAAASIAEVAASARKSEPEARQALGLLHRAKLIGEDAGGAFSPARHPNTITLADVSRAAADGKATSEGFDEQLGAVAGGFVRADAAAQQALASTKIADLCHRPSPSLVPTGALAKP
jgi:membrane protein